MSTSDGMKETMAQAYVDRAKKLSVHTGDPGSTGDNELSGVTRQDLTWTPRVGGPPFNIPVSGTQDSNVVTFDIPANTTLTHVGIYDEFGTYQDSQVVDFTFDSAGSYSTSITYTYEGA